MIINLIVIGIIVEFDFVVQSEYVDISRISSFSKFSIQLNTKNRSINNNIQVRTSQCIIIHDNSEQRCPTNLDKILSEIIEFLGTEFRWEVVECRKVWLPMRF